MKKMGRIGAAFVLILTLLCTPALAKFGGGGFGGSRSFGGGFGGGFGGSRSSGGSFGGFGGGRSFSEPAPEPSFAPPAPRSSFGGSGGGSFGGSRSSFGSQSFGGGFHPGPTTTGSYSGIGGGPGRVSTFTTNRAPAPFYQGAPVRYQSFGGPSYPVYYTHPWSSYSFGWLAPHPWWYSYNPFWPGFYFHQPYYYGGGYVDGGFNWFGLLIGILFFAIIIRLLIMGLGRLA